MPQPSIVYIAGCFDLFHPGHLHLIQQAQKHGDQLLVAIVTDQAMRQYKDDGRPIITEQERMNQVANIPGVHKTFLCNEDPHGISVIEKIQPNTLVMGRESDSGQQQEKIQKLKKHFVNMEIILIEKKNPEKYSTTAIINTI